MRQSFTPLCILLVLCNFLLLLNLHKIKKQEKTENKHSRARPKDLRSLAMCLHPRENTAPHHHIDHEITSSIQAATSFDLSWFLLFQNLSQSPSSLSLSLSLY